MERYNGHLIALNPVLLERMKITPTRYDLLMQTHRLKLDIFDVMSRVAEREVLRGLAETVTAIEFAQQNLWGWAQDKNYHLFWLAPHCRCPDLENTRRWCILHIDYFAYPGPAYSDDCLIHGKEQKDADPLHPHQ